MAVTETLADHLASTYRQRGLDVDAKLRFLRASITQGAAAGDDGSTVVIGDLPFGEVSIIPSLSRYKVSALGASRVMKIGHQEYISRNNAAQTTEADDDNAFASGIDVSGATEAFFPVTGGMSFDMISARGIRLYATITGGTIPAAATFEFNIAYLIAQ